MRDDLVTDDRVEQGKGAWSQRQRARSLVMFGKHVKLKAGVDVTPTGLVSIGVLVCGILLSTSVLVATAIREARR